MAVWLRFHRVERPEKAAMAELSQFRMVRLPVKEATDASSLCQRAQHHAKVKTAELWQSHVVATEQKVQTAVFD